MMEKMKSPHSLVALEQQNPPPPVSPTPNPSPSRRREEAEASPLPASPASASPPLKGSPPSEPSAPLPHNVPVISLGHSKHPGHADVSTTPLTALHPIPGYLQLTALPTGPPPSSMPLAGVRSPLLAPQYQPHPFLNRSFPAQVWFKDVMLLVKLCPTHHDPTDNISPGLPVLHHPPESTEAHANCFSDSI
ncbi:Protein lyl-1 [Varanus komodoensis]|nr:Protein lyl-1 [Varanus komodoensis]